MMKITHGNQYESCQLAALKQLYKKVFLGSLEGKKILDDLAIAAGMFKAGHASENICFENGRRSLYLYITSYLNDMPSDVHKEIKN